MQSSNNRIFFCMSVSVASLPSARAHQSNHRVRNSGKGVALNHGQCFVLIVARATIRVSAGGYLVLVIDVAL